MKNSIAINQDRYGWVDFAKGICIVAVVTLYAKNQVGHFLGNAGWLDDWVRFARPFRMPDFFLLSGLFLGRVLDRPWRSYLDTKVAHYLYFLVLWTLIIVPWNWLSVSWDVTPWTAFKNIVYSIYRPDAMLWFIQMLAVYFVVTRLLRRVPWWCMLPAAAVLKMLDYHTGIYPVDWFGEYYVFFYTGYYFAKSIFQYSEWVQGNRAKAMAIVLAWIIGNAYATLQPWSTNPLVFQALGFVGIMAVISISTLLQRYSFMNWLRYLGENSIVLYLGFYLPMLFMIWACGALGYRPNPGVFATAITAASILTALSAFWATRGTRLAFLFTRPTWAHLVPKVARKVGDARTGDPVA